MYHNIERKVKQRITLHIHDIAIPIKISQEEEPMYREAGALINERLNTYFEHYQNTKSNKEIFIYAMIDIALRCIHESKRNDTEPIMSLLEKLDKEIKENLL